LIVTTASWRPSCASTMTSGSICARCDVWRACWHVEQKHRRLALGRVLGLQRRRALALNPGGLPVQQEAWPGWHC
jgi:hypothetical protein